MVLQAGRRVAPTTNGESLAKSTAEFLFSDGIVTVSNKFLVEQLPKAKEFLDFAGGELNAALADLNVDRAYISSNQTSETYQQVFDRKLAIFGRLQVFTERGYRLFHDDIAVWDQEVLEGIPDIDAYGHLRLLRLGRLGVPDRARRHREDRQGPGRLRRVPGPAQDGRAVVPSSSTTYTERCAASPTT